MKKALLTGSTGGLGKEVAEILAQDGWDLILLNRNQELSQQQLQSLNNRFPSQTFDSFVADLMDLEDIQKACQEISAAHPQITALYNIAGFLTDKRITSPQGIEGHFAINAVAPYMLANQLRPLLKAGAKEQEPAFIVNFSSSAIKSVKTLDTNKLVNPDTIGGLMDAYAKTKAVLNIMACFMADDLSEDNIYVYSVDPGATKTKMTKDNGGMPWFIKLLVPVLFADPSKQAQKLVDGVHQASKNKETGVFVVNGKVKKNPPLAYDLKTQADLKALMDSLVTQ